MFTLIVTVLAALAAIAIVLKALDAVTVDTATISRRATPNGAEHPPGTPAATAGTGHTGSLR
jgi:hypothetical protein